VSKNIIKLFRIFSKKLRKAYVMVDGGWWMVEDGGS